MMQSVAGGNEHAPVVSLHVSVVHGAPSEQVLAVAQLPDALQTPQPATDPSSQVVPVRALQVVVLTPDVQIWHGLAGFTVPFA